MSVQSVVLNEGLKTIGSETFRSSKIKRIVISKSVTKIDKCAFENCKNLKEVVFEGGSKLEKIGFGCFKDSELEEITLPKTLQDVGWCVFEYCKDLRTIYVEDGCEASLVRAQVPDSTCVISLSTVLAGGVSV